MSIWRETKRECKWAWHSLTIHLTAIAGILFGIWNFYSSVAYQTEMKKYFTASLQRANEAGQSLEQALALPLDITTTPDGRRTISNPLRYDYEALTQAASVLSGSGMVANTLSSACFLFLPFAGFTIGITAASHDLRSGGIVLRWPQTTPIKFLVSKINLGIGLVFITAFMSALISAFLGIFLGGSDKTLPPAPTPSLLQLLALSCFAVFIGAVFVLIGLFVGSSLTKRSIPLITFFALYYLTPLLGKWDPRQWITASGDSVIHYIGAFRIPATENNLLASVLLLLLTVLSLSGFFAIWPFRRKLPTQGVK